MDSQTCPRHACQGPKHPWEPQSGMGDSARDVEHCDQFVFVDASVGLPVQVSHRVKFAIFGAIAPHCEERAVDSKSLDEFLDNFNGPEIVVLNPSFQGEVLYSDFP